MHVQNEDFVLTSPLRFSRHRGLAGFLRPNPVRFGQEGEIATQESTALSRLLIGIMFEYARSWNLRVPIICVYYDTSGRRGRRTSQVPRTNVLERTACTCSATKQIIVIVIALTRIIKSAVTEQAPATLESRKNPREKLKNKPKVVHVCIYHIHRLLLLLLLLLLFSH